MCSQLVSYTGKILPRNTVIPPEGSAPITKCMHAPNTIIRKYARTVSPDNYSDIQGWLSSNNPFIQQLISNVYRVNARLLVFVEIEA